MITRDEYVGAAVTQARLDKIIREIEYKLNWLHRCGKINPTAENPLYVTIDELSDLEIDAVEIELESAGWNFLSRGNNGEMFTVELW